MSDNEQKRASEIYEWWGVYREAADKLDAEMVAALSQHANGVGGKPTYGLELLLKAHRQREAELWKELEGLIGV